MEDLLADVLKKHPDLPKNERAFLLELVQGVKRWELRLDYLLSRLSRLAWPKVHPLVRHILRLGAYQILFLDKIPAHAAVDEAARLARRRRLPVSHVGFINAILRRLAAGEVPSLPEITDDPVAALAVETAHPVWLTARWLSRYGLEEARARLAANNQVPPLTVRVNTLKIDLPGLIERLSQEGVEAVPCKYSPVGLLFQSFDRAPATLPSYREGLWLFQDEAAQLTTCLLPLAPGQKILEIGAGRGGKTTYLGERLHNRGLILALDSHRQRLGSLHQNLRRWGVTCAQAIRGDGTQALPVKPGSLDAVVIDAPCSALGIIRRHPEIKTRLSEIGPGHLSPQATADALPGRTPPQTGGPPPLHHLHHRTRGKRRPGDGLPGRSPGIPPGLQARACARAGPGLPPAPRLFSHYTDPPQFGWFLRRGIGARVG